MTQGFSNTTVSLLLHDQLLHLVHSVMDGEIPEFDLRNAVHSEQICRAADRLLDECASAAPLDQLEQQLFHERVEEPIMVHLALKLARSKAIVRALEQPLHVSFVMAVYKEHTRLLRPDQHPHGEDCLVKKIEQLRWLFDASAYATWSVFIVDDGCPEGSGLLAKEILAARCPDAPVRVLFLQDALDSGLAITRPMKSTADSQKGGSIVFGMWTAAERRDERHIVVFTDADLSVNVAQTGLLIDGILGEKKDAAIGSRRETTSVVVKSGHRNIRGKLFIYLWKGLIEPLNYITDTQCGFKAFTAETVHDVLTDLIEKRFAFDIELLLKTELRRGKSIAKIPIAWIDSEAASTATGLQPYLSMLQAVAGMYRRYLPADREADRLAAMIESMTESEWEYLSNHVPSAIADGDPLEFDRTRDVTVDGLIDTIEH